MAQHQLGNKPLSKPTMVSLSMHKELRHSDSLLWPLMISTRDKMDAISQTPFSSAFSGMKMFEFRLKSHWSLFLRVQLTISQHWFRQWLGAVQVTSHYLKQLWLVYQRIYASLGLNELTSVVCASEIKKTVFHITPHRQRSMTYYISYLIQIIFITESQIFCSKTCHNELEMGCHWTKADSLQHWNDLEIFADNMGTTST